MVKYEWRVKDKVKLRVENTGCVSAGVNWHVLVNSKLTACLAYIILTAFHYAHCTLLLRNIFNKYLFQT